MKIGDEVQTPLGRGAITAFEGEKGTRTERYCVLIDGELSESQKRMQENQGGLYFWRIEIERVEK